MGKDSAISWCDNTFNPWWVCTEVSPGCDHCYARTFAKRLGWGKGAPRREFGDAHWNEPLKWNAAAQRAGKPAKVFCASMADWCDAEAPAGALERLHVLWRATPWLRWQMLTKRPGRIARSLPPDWGQGYPNVWLGTTVEDQEHADQRVPVLLSVPARVRFLSMEPLLGPVDLWNAWLRVPEDAHSLSQHVGARIDQVIVGGESGHGARPFSAEWARHIKAQCEQAGTAFWMKQMGERWAMEANAMRPAVKKGVDVMAKDTHGTNPLNWPEDLRVQQFPEAP